MNFSAGLGGTEAVWIEPASGWFIENLHCDSVGGPVPLYFYGASVMHVNNVYIENWGTGDLSEDRWGIKVEKVKPGGGVHLSNVAMNVTSNPNSTVTQGMAFIRGGASAGAFCRLFNFRMGHDGTHDAYAGVHYECATNGSLIVAVDGLSVEGVDAAFNAGSGTVTLRDAGNNSWDF